MRYQSSRLHECQGDVFREWVINAATFISRKIRTKELFEISVEEGRNRLIYQPVLATLVAWTTASRWP